MRQEHIDAIQSAIRELTIDENNPSQVVRLTNLRQAFVAIFEHLCQHEENHLVVGGEDISATARRILEQSPPGLDRRSTSSRNIEP